jgi:HEAT repeat protein
VSFALLVLLAPPLLWRASLRAALRREEVQRDVALVAQPGLPGRVEARARLAALGPPGVAALIDGLGRFDVPSLMHTLRNRERSDVIGPLVAALDDDDEDVRHYSGMTLALIGADALPALTQALATSPVVRVRTSAAWVLSFMGAEGVPALPALQAALEDEHKDVRHVARYAIAQLGSGNEAFWEAVDQARREAPQPTR